MSQHNTAGTAKAPAPRIWNNPSYLQSSTGIFLFYCSWGIWWAFYQRWLNTVGLNGAEVGTIYSINSVVTLVLMFGYGLIQDNLGLKRRLVLAVSLIAALIGPFVQFVYAPLMQVNMMAAALVGSVVLSAGFMAGSSLVEAITERYSRRFGFEYGQARGWGSFGYAVVALVSGIMFNINPMINFWLSSAFGIGMFLVYLTWYPAEQKDALREAADPDAPKSTPSIKDMAKVLGMPSLWIMIVFAIMTNTFYTVFDQQLFPSYYVSLFPSETMGDTFYGVLSSATVFLESAMMGVIPLFMRKVGVKTTLLSGATVMFLRIGLCGIFTDPVIVSIVKMFHGIEVPLILLPTFRYFTLHFDTKLSATLYMIGFQIASQIGQVIFSTPLGMLHDHLGNRPTFLTISAVVLTAVVLGRFVIMDDDRQVDGDPFIRDGARNKLPSLAQDEAKPAATDQDM